MSLEEIEIVGSSISFRCLSLKVDSLSLLLSKIRNKEQEFSIEPENPGFHDCDGNKRIIRGFFSRVTPFEVEHLVEDIVTKTLLKKIERCEFIILSDLLFISGKPGPQKLLEPILASLTGHEVTPIEFELEQLSRFQDRLAVVKSISLINPRHQEIRRVRLAGKIENYTDYNIVDPKNHEIESVSGLLDTPQGPMTVTASRKGTLRLNVKAGTIISLDCLLWILGMIRDEKPPDRFSVT